MADLSIKLIWSDNKKDVARVEISCSADIIEQVQNDVLEIFELEMIQGGHIKNDAEKCIIKFTLTDPDKITKLRVGIMRTFMKRSSIDHLTLN